MDVSDQIYWLLLLAGVICLIAIRIIEKAMKRNKNKSQD